MYVLAVVLYGSTFFEMARSWLEFQKYMCHGEGI